MSKLQQSEKAIKSYGVVSHDKIERISVMASDEDITSLKGWKAIPSQRHAANPPTSDSWSTDPPFQYTE